ncbi:MAG: RsmB/NOP family class I SAM-dependent RNA methyltransferase [archaeon]
MEREIPNSEKIEFKPAFEERYKALLLDRYEDYKKISLTFLRRAIRINTLKIDISTLKQKLEKRGWILEAVPWCEEGFYVHHIEGRRDIGSTPEHALGYYYVQEPASMVPPIVLSPNKNELILDMCASPGSKATQMAQYMENTGILIANDFTGERLKALGINMQMMGITNAIVTLMYGQWFSKSGIMFDRILVDAPCSGTGTIRKSFKTLRIWNPTMVSRLAATQKKLIEAAFSVLKPGGTMVYSTCSQEPEEDEGVVSYLLEQFSDATLEDIHLEIKRSTCFNEFDGVTFHKDIRKCLRLWPMDNDTEGFFVAKIRKN